MSTEPDLERVHPQLLRARRLMGRCRLRAASRACAAVLLDEPDNIQATALRARLEAMTRRMTNNEAGRIIQELMAASPDDTYVKVASAALMAQAGERSGAIATLQRLVTENPSDPYAHQVLAGLLGCENTSLNEAWVHYKAALEHGPLRTLGYKEAAFYLAKRYEPQ